MSSQQDIKPSSPKEAMLSIAATTLQNISDYEKDGKCINNL
jgi:hypothetical protein